MSIHLVLTETTDGVAVTARDSDVGKGITLEFLRFLAGKGDQEAQAAIVMIDAVNQKQAEGEK